jgi:ribokinase
LNIVTVGGITLDIIVAGADEKKRIPGTKQDVEHINMYLGGGAANTALNFTKLGATVKIICAVGADLEGMLLADALATEGLELSGLQRVRETSTGKAVIHVDAAGRAEVFACRGASTQLAISSGCIPRSTDILYIAALSDYSAEHLSLYLNDLKTLPSKIVINPSARQVQQRSVPFLNLLGRADLVCLNEHEAQLLADPAADSHRQLSLDDSAEVATQIWKEFHCDVLLTSGSKGAVFRDANGVTFQSSLPASIKSTLGAGDAFCSTFSFYWVSRLSTAECLKRSTLASVDVLNVMPGNLAKPIRRA